MVVAMPHLISTELTELPTFSVIMLRFHFLQRTDTVTYIFDFSFIYKCVRVAIYELQTTRSCYVACANSLVALRYGDFHLVRG